MPTDVVKWSVCSIAGQLYAGIHLEILLPSSRHIKFNANINAELVKRCHVQIDNEETIANRASLTHTHGGYKKYPTERVTTDHLLTATLRKPDPTRAANELGTN